MRWMLYSVSLLLLIPCSVSARVVINEIAWMGTNTSASDEWIELHNTGTSSVDVTDWKLLAEDGTPEIILEGTISADGYFLLERTDDDSVPGVLADQLYVGGLGNGGETLQLFNNTETLQDEVVGGTGWEAIGGDNGSKNTPQRQNGDMWVTGTPTPKVVNTTEDTGGEETDDAQGVTTPPKKKEQTYKRETFVHIFGGDREITAGSKVTFRGIAFRESGRKQRGARYVWNMGNGERRTSEDIRFSYNQAGDYTVVLKVVDGFEQIKKSIQVSVLPAHVTIPDVAVGASGYVRIKNEGTIPLDMSEWVLTAGDTSFTFPDDTLIGVSHSVPFLNSVTGLVLAMSTHITLLYPHGEVATEYGDED